MTEQVPSDSLLIRLRKRVEIARTVESNVSLHPDQVLALVEIAEAAHPILQEVDWESDCNCVQCLTVGALNAALAKLEAL